MQPHNKTRGGALLTALFIMTLVAIVATAMSTRLQLDIYRTRLIIIHDKLYLASQAVTFWSLGELNNKKNKFIKVDDQGMVDAFPKNRESIYPQVTLSGGLYDLQARFNLNNLVDKKFTLPFINLLGMVDSNANSMDKINLAMALKNWLMTYDLSRGKDIYTSYYHSQKPAYNPSHQLMKSRSEFRLVKDVTAPLFLALEPYITVLPETTPININTAPKKLLMSLGNGLSDAQSNELIMARGETGIEDLKDIDELIKKIDLPSEQITIESKYFLSVAFAKSDEFKLVIYTLMQRDKDKKGTITVSIIRESINYF
ncbi:type II secretion system minor pseudopilin GspK [Legionella bononiensis]|uniref:Type II secretion system protein K n=1 Tax=Legionella bononiensis TaxID=2793102 RepID=A0ABS1WBI5_9GAMM|nr:type II secretion system minor pseudopilin GspK [Legionella bononiensis]MBL7481004.1 type II secretion system minor pseudopilin GspK [Legionella bononiensis]MBL7526712.1 type II secretion system minor pseudopilin GspK [Legionella bononiensis]MBL7564119.1 type II secretion system minor pseudopilin GspK [Legionella bononiensis]